MILNHQRNRYTFPAKQNHVGYNAKKLLRAFYRRLYFKSIVFGKKLNKTGVTA